MIKIEKQNGIRIDNNLFSGVLFSIISLTLWFLVPAQIKIRNTTQINAQTFPKIIIGIVFISSALLIVTSILNREKKYFYINKRFIENELRPFIMATIILIYVFSIQKIGFIISSFLLCVVIVRFFNIKNKNYYLITCGSSLIISFVFIKLLNVLLP